MTQVPWLDLLDAYGFANLGADCEHRAFIDRENGRIYFCTGEEIPEELDMHDWENQDRFLELPRAQDLELGVYMVLDFVAKKLPQDYGTVSNFFQQKDSYIRFKQLMGKRGCLDEWYRFEADVTANALRVWCRRNRLEPIQFVPGVAATGGLSK